MPGGGVGVGEGGGGVVGSGVESLMGYSGRW